MSTGMGSLSLFSPFLSTGVMAAVGILLLGALALLVVNKRNRPLRMVCGVAASFGVIYFALIAVLVFLFGSNAHPGL